MACSAIYFLDMKGKVLISRNYRGDIDNSVIDKFIGINSFVSVIFGYRYRTNTTLKGLPLFGTGSSISECHTVKYIYLNTGNWYRFQISKI